jgi:hypothetical protein
VKKDSRFEIGISVGMRARASAASRRGECFARMSRAGRRNVGFAERYIVRRVWNTRRADCFLESLVVVLAWEYIRMQ